MATRIFSSPMRQPLLSSISIRLSSTASSSSIGRVGTGVLDLDDTERLFASASTGNLLRTLLILRALALEPAANLVMTAAGSDFVMRNSALRAAVMAAMKATAYRHFCAGENLEEAAKTLQKLWDEGIQGILDYGLEDAIDDVSCDANLTEFLNTVDITSRLPPSSVSFACVKITAICTVHLLERISEQLRWEKESNSAAAPWRRHRLPVLCAASQVHLTAPPPPLTQEEERALDRAHRRLRELCNKCAEANLPLLVDAEYTSVQPAIDYLALEAAREFNRGGFPMVYTTVQAYLKDAEERMEIMMEAAEKERMVMGLKLVRGAYMKREEEMAKEIGAPSPIHGSIGETHRCYDRCAGIALQKSARGGAAVVLATHNLNSGKVAAAKAEELGIGRGNERLQFAQLKGMAEGLSLGLRNAGFHVSKYLPFGPVDQVIPYLLRRAQENRGFLSSSTVDRDLIWKELKRRLTESALGR